MKNMTGYFKEHKRAALIGLFFLIVFVGCSAVSAVHVATERAREDTAMQAGQEAAGGKQEETEDVPLTDSQKEAIAAYDDETSDFIETLGASVWSAQGGKYTLRFLDNDRYIETVNGEAVQHSFAIARIDFSSDTSGVEIDTVVFETDTGTHVVTYTNQKITDGEGSGTSSSSLSSASMFQLKDMGYERADAVENITVKGLNSEITALLDGDTDKLTSEISNWCSVHYPSVTAAQWNGVASIDWESNVVTTDFTLNSENPSTLTVVYKRDAGEFTFGY